MGVVRRVENYQDRKILGKLKMCTSDLGPHMSPPLKLQQTCADKLVIEIFQITGRPHFVVNEMILRSARLNVPQILNE